MDQFMVCRLKVGEGTITKLEACPRPQPQAVTEHDAVGWTDVHKKSVKVKVNTLMYGQWALATGLSSLLARWNKSPRLILRLYRKLLSFFGCTGTISRFGERFRDGQYSLVTFLFFVPLLLPPCHAVICKRVRTRAPEPYMKSAPLSWDSFTPKTL